MKDKIVTLSSFVGRLLIGGMFVYAGVGKIMNFSGTVAFIEAVGLPIPTIAALLAILVEVLGGLSIILGWRIRLGAGTLFVFAGVVTLLLHTDFANQIQMTLFIKNAAIMGGLLYMVAFGAGKYSHENTQLNQ